MSLAKVSILIQIIIIGLFVGELKAGIVTSNNDELKSKNGNYFIQILHLSEILSFV